MTRPLPITVALLCAAAVAVWTALLATSGGDAAEDAAAATAPVATSSAPVPVTRAEVVTVAPPHSAAPAPSTTQPAVRVERGEEAKALVPGGGVGLVEWREVEDANPVCTVVSTRLRNGGSAPVAAVSLDFAVRTADADGTWRDPVASGRQEQAGLDLAPGTEALLDWEVCLSSFAAPTYDVSAAPDPATLDWTWRI